MPLVLAIPMPVKHLGRKLRQNWNPN